MNAPGRRHDLPAPDPAAAAHSAVLARQIAAAIAQAGGWIGFDRYMAQALYAPGLGYYAAGARKFGAAAVGGDFVTAPELSPLFGGALARQVEALFDALPPVVLEFGAGSGALARDLMAALAARGTPLREYLIVEVSPDLRERQAASLRTAPVPVRWLDAPPAGFAGVALANEVLDVLPVRLFVRDSAGVAERGVTVHGGAFAFAARPADAELAQAVAALEQAHGVLPTGYGSEVGLAARGWLRSAGDWLDRGVLLAFDYGFPAREYYHPQRLMGTLMCHFRHRAHGDPFFLPGLNDITAHVDFSAMADAALDGGLAVLGYTTQAHFLLNCGALDLVGAVPAPARRAELQRLVSEAEMGELVKVLAVGRGVAAPLVGFARGDRRHRL